MGTRSAAARSEDPRRTRDLILDVAERQFAEHGFSGVSMRRITADTGLRNQASLYHHFRNKRALYEAVIARGITPILDLLNEAGSAPRDDIVDRITDVLVAHPNLPRLIQRAGLDDSRHLGRAVTRLLEPLYEVGMRVLAGEGRAWRAAELPHLAAGLYHVIFGYFANAALLETVLGEDLRGPAAVDRQRKFVKAALGRLLDDGPRPRLVRTTRRS